MILLPTSLPYIDFDNLTNPGPPYDSLNLNHQILDDLTKQLTSITTPPAEQLLFSRNSSPVNESSAQKSTIKHSNENDYLKKFGGKPLTDTDFDQKKTRRVSIFLNKKNDKEKRRASIDVSTFITNNHSGQRRHSSVHHHRKLSHDSIKIRSNSNCPGRKNSRHSTSVEGGSIDKPSTSASSRESSDSSRKMSINSHGGNNKIPWCGCWGNGCF